MDMCIGGLGDHSYLQSGERWMNSFKSMVAERMARAARFARRTLDGLAVSGPVFWPGALALGRVLIKEKGFSFRL